MISINKEKVDNNFIVNLSSQEIRQVREDILMYRKGYFFFYAVDTYDIISHFLPYTDGDLVNSLNKNILAQKAVAYEKFFTTFLNNKLIVLNEYKGELLAAKSHIEKQIKNIGFLNSNINLVKDEISKIKSSDIKQEKFRENIELILFLLILSENKNNVYKNFFDFLNNKLSIFNFDTADIDRDIILQDVFNNCQPSKKVESVYDAFFEKTVYHLSKLKTDLEKYAYLENSYRDIEVIDRLNNINFELKTKYPEQKSFFIYLSSTPYKSGELISVFQSQSTVITNDKERQYFSSYNFHRHIFQCFLFKVLIEEFPDIGDDTPLEILDSLELLSIQTKNFSKTDKVLNVGSSKDNNIKILNKILDRYSSNIDNHFYFKIYNKYQAILDSSSSHLDNEITQILKDVHTYLKNENILVEGQDILYNINQYKQTYLLSKLIDPSSKLWINVQFGRDIIKDSFHHLPYLLLIDDKIPHEITKYIYPLLLTISRISSTKFTNTQDIAPFLKSILNELNKNSESLISSAVRFLITTYLYITTETSNDRKNKIKRDRELEVIEILKKQKKMFSNAITKFKATDDNLKLSVVKTDFPLTREFDYIILWLLRRNKLFTEAINLGNELVSIYNDVRFYHGLALSYVAQAYAYITAPSQQKNHTDLTLNFLDSAMLWLRKAKESYYKLIQNFTDVNAILLLKQNLIAILNSLADTAIRKFSLQTADSNELLLESKGNIEQIKEICKSISLDYSTLPIYNLTEAELMYYEALFLFRKDDLNNAFIKITEAGQIYATAKINESITHDSFKTIIHSINVLRAEIFSKKGTF